MNEKREETAFGHIINASPTAWGLSADRGSSIASFSAPGSSLTREGLLAYIETVTGLLDDASLRRFAEFCFIMYDEMQKHTPKAIKRKESENQAKRAALARSLERPGFILIAWANTLLPHSLRPMLLACYLPETGPRWCHSFYGSLDDAASLKPRCPYLGKAHYQTSIKDWISWAEGDHEYGEAPLYGTPAVHLLEPGPDRRPAYLQRRAVKVIDITRGSD